MARPEVREKQRAAAKARWARPEEREKLRAAAKARWARPEVREKQRAAAKARWARQWAWCPAELRDDYRILAKHLGAAAARQSIEAQIGRRQ
ncbi:MAG TPA: hypothetical protein VNK91_02335 [Burkholderiaceae bacterium]|nr:hypothetical protein [Burkholderiaceae bacterium]